MNIYTNGQYQKDHPNWHDEDAEWKTDEIVKLLKKNQLKPESIIDIGCGSGKIISILTQKFKPQRALGFEPFDELVKKATINYPRLTFSSTLPSQTFDIAIFIDVIEHLEKPEQILKKMKKMANYKVFHIPLALSLQARLRKKPIEYARKHSGHLREFTQQSALEFLVDNGYKVVDYYLTKGSIMTPTKSAKQRFLNIFRRIFFPICPNLTSKILGGFSLIVLAK